MLVRRRNFRKLSSKFQSHSKNFLSFLPNFSRTCDIDSVGLSRLRLDELTNFGRRIRKFLMRSDLFLSFRIRIIAVDANNRSVVGGDHICNTLRKLFCPFVCDHFISR